MDLSRRHILLAVQPAVLEGALATMLAEASRDRIVQMGHGRVDAGDYDAAVVSDRLPAGVRAGVVITLPDTRGNGGRGTVRRGDVVHEVEIGGAERVAELLTQYLPRR
jgi:hypothetical protein